MSGERYRASTRRARGATNRVPVSRDTNRPSPTYSLFQWKVTFPLCESRSATRA